MTTDLLLFTRKDCCLCEEMKEIVRRSAERHSLAIQEIDVDGSPQLQQMYGDEVPILFINGRKAFKYRVTSRELEKRLKDEQS